jgi:hypothetical protein
VADQQHINPGEIKTIDGVEYWVEPDGYSVEIKFVRKYPALFGPIAADPDHGEGDIECDDTISRIMNKLTGIGGTYSTWKERHCSIVAAGIGYNDVETSADVPPCPKFWLSENQYWVGHLAIGREAKKQDILNVANSTFAGLLQNKKVLASLGAAAVSGAAVLPAVIPPILQAILKLIGIAT